MWDSGARGGKGAGVVGGGGKGGVVAPCAGFGYFLVETYWANVSGVGELTGLWPPLPENPTPLLPTCLLPLQVCRAHLQSP